MGLHPATPPVMLGAMILFALYLAYEIVRWIGGNRAMLTPGQFRRRMLGGFLLELDLALWFLANPLMAGHPPREKLIYLLTATGLLIVPVLLAVREAAFVVRQYARWRGELIREMGRKDLQP